MQVERIGLKNSHNSHNVTMSHFHQYIIAQSIAIRVLGDLASYEEYGVNVPSPSSSASGFTFTTYAVPKSSSRLTFPVARKDVN